MCVCVCLFVWVLYFSSIFCFGIQLHSNLKTQCSRFSSHRAHTHIYMTFCKLQKKKNHTCIAHTTLHTHTHTHTHHITHLSHYTHTHTHHITHLSHYTHTHTSHHTPITLHTHHITQNHTQNYQPTCVDAGGGCSVSQRKNRWILFLNGSTSTTRDELGESGRDEEIPSEVKVWRRFGRDMSGSRSDRPYGLNLKMGRVGVSKQGGQTRTEREQNTAHTHTHTHTYTHTPTLTLAKKREKKGHKLTKNTPLGIKLKTSRESKMPSRTKKSRMMPWTQKVKIKKEKQSEIRFPAFHRHVRIKLWLLNSYVHTQRPSLHYSVLSRNTTHTHTKESQHTNIPESSSGS